MSSNKHYRIKKRAKNPFEARTGVATIQLTGTSDCLICLNKRTFQIPSHKVSYAIANDWQDFELTLTAKRMKNLRVKQTCGVDQCVNPDHLVGTELEINPWN